MSPPTTTDEPPTTPMPKLPTIDEVPRDSAVDAEILAATMLDTIRRWAPPAAAGYDFAHVGDVRRQVGQIAATLYRRTLSKTATLDAQEAARIADRVAGIVIRNGQAAGLVRSRGQSNMPGVPHITTLIGKADRSGIYRFAQASDDEFAAALAHGRAVGSLAMDALIGHLGGLDLNPFQQQQKDRIGAMAADGFTSRQIAKELGVSTNRVSELARRYAVTITGDVVSRNTRKIDPSRIITETIPQLDGLASAAQQVDEDDIAKLDAAQAKDWALQLHRALAPVIALQRALRTRGKEA